MIRVIAAAALAVVLVVSPAVAHEGHVHKVMGTVTSVQGSHVEVKTTEGKTVSVTLDDKTTVTRGKEKLDASAIKVGERVSIDAMQDKDVMMAHAVKLATAPAAK